MHQSERKYGKFSSRLNVNSAESDRIAYLRQHGFYRMIGPQNRDLFKDYGWKQPNEIKFIDLKTLYDSSGLIANVLQLITQTAVVKPPKIRELKKGKSESDDDSMTAWEELVEELADAVRFYPALAQLAERGHVGDWSGLVLHFREADPQWSQPVGSGAELVKVQPVWSGQLRATFDENTGEVTKWHYTTLCDGVTQTDGSPSVARDIHPDRVVVFAPQGMDQHWEAVGSMRRAYNAICDMLKTQGAAPEIMLQNAGGPITAEEVTPGTFSDLKSNLKDDQDALDKYMKDLGVRTASGLNNVLYGGIKFGRLTTEVPDAENIWNVVIKAVAGAFGVPVSIITGEMTGNLASEENKKAMNARAARMQRFDMEPFILRFLRHLERLGIINVTPKRIKIDWQDLDTATDDQRAGVALKMAQANASASAAGFEPWFTRAEARVMMGYNPDEPADDPLPPRDPSQQGGQPTDQPPPDNSNPDNGGGGDGN